MSAYRLHHQWKSEQEPNSNLTLNPHRALLLAHLPAHAYLDILVFSSMTPCPEDVLGPPIVITNQDSLPQICSQTNLTRAVPQLRLHSQMTLGCVELG